MPLNEYKENLLRDFLLSQGHTEAQMEMDLQKLIGDVTRFINETLKPHTTYDMIVCSASLTAVAQGLNILASRQMDQEKVSGAH